MRDTAYQRMAQARLPINNTRVLYRPYVGFFPAVTLRSLWEWGLCGPLQGDSYMGSTT
jgi:hypothetical protein